MRTQRGFFRRRLRSLSGKGDRLTRTVSGDRLTRTMSRDRLTRTVSGDRPTKTMSGGPTHKDNVRGPTHKDNVSGSQGHYQGTASIGHLVTNSQSRMLMRFALLDYRVTNQISLNLPKQASPQPIKLPH